MGWGTLIWQVFNLLFLGGILFLVIRLLVIKNFPRKKALLDNAWVGIPPYSIGIFWRTEDARFIAEIPDLPGCVASGATQAEALANAAIVIKEWLETAQKLNRPVPAPHLRLRNA